MVMDVARNSNRPANSRLLTNAPGVFAAVAFMASVLMATGADIAAAQARKLRITLQLPVTTHLGVNLQQFDAAIGKATGGALSLEIYDKGERYPEDRALKAVASGDIEMAVIGFNQFSATVPAIDIVQQPFLLNTDRLVEAATDPSRDIRKLVDAAILQTLGLRALWWQGYGNTVIFSRGGDASQPSRIKGKKVRVLGGETMAQMVRECGGTPVFVSAAKMAQAMKDGEVDMIMVGVSSVESRRLWEVSDTITRTDHAALEFLVVINDAVWQSLPADQRDAMTVAAQQVERSLREQMPKVEAAAYHFAASKGMSVRSLTPNEIAEWRACSSPTLESYMAREAQAIQRVLFAYGRLRLDPCCSDGPGGTFTRN